MKKNATQFLYFLFTISFYLFSSPLFAQNNYVPGYIIQSTDSIKGYINYTYWDLNPNKIEFKQTLEDAPSLFGPLDIDGFGVEGDKYVSAIVDVELSPRNELNIKEGAGLNMRRDTTFLRILLQGKKDLYSYIDESANESFYIFQEGKFHLLLFKRYYIMANGFMVSQENTKYKGQLIYFFQNPSLNDRIEKLHYDRESMMQLFTVDQISRNESFTFVYQKPKARLKLAYGPMLSLTNTNFSVPRVPSAEFEDQKSLSGGLFIDLILSRELEYALTAEIHYYHTSQEGTYSQYDYNNRPINTRTFEYDFSFFEVNYLLRALYKANETKVFVNLGLQKGYLLEGSYYIKYEVFSRNEITINEGDIDGSSKENGFILGGGFIINKVSIEARLTKSTLEALPSGYNGYAKKIGLFVSYRF